MKTPYHYSSDHSWGLVTNLAFRASSTWPASQTLSVCEMSRLLHWCGASNASASWGLSLVPLENLRGNDSGGEGNRYPCRRQCFRQWPLCWRTSRWSFPYPHKIKLWLTSSHPCISTISLFPTQTYGNSILLHFPHRTRYWSPILRRETHLHYFLWPSSSSRISPGRSGLSRRRASRFQGFLSQVPPDWASPAESLTFAAVLGTRPSVSSRITLLPRVVSLTVPSTTSPPNIVLRLL